MTKLNFAMPRLNNAMAKLNYTMPRLINATPGLNNTIPRLNDAMPGVKSEIAKINGKVPFLVEKKGSVRQNCRFGLSGTNLKVETHRGWFLQYLDFYCKDEASSCAEQVVPSLRIINSYWDIELPAAGKTFKMIMIYYDPKKS